MSKFKATFTLKQHTPIIHFQSDQSGATLRATELKPKFDRFLKAVAFHGDIPKGYKISDDKDALDYKVKIIEKKVRTDEIDLNGLPDERLFMGNMGGGSIKQMFHRNSDIFVTLISFNSDLIVLLEEYFANFIMQTNFGGGSSKGFGSFTVNDKEVIHYPLNTYSFVSTGKSLENVNSAIAYFYKMLKSGINEYDKNSVSIFYGKSLLWLYVNTKEKNVTWEKKKIKECFFSEELGSQKKKYPDSEMLLSNKEPFLYRDLLGLSLESDWMSYNNATVTKTVIGGDKVDRFASPLVFKPVLIDGNYVVYYWGKDIPTEILDREFKFSSETKKPFNIKTPKTFDIHAYLEFISIQNMKTHIESKFQHSDIFKILNPLFNSIEKIENNAKEKANQ